MDTILNTANWQSTKFDFEGEHWADVAQKWVPELNMNVGSSISALRKSWQRYRKARRIGYADEVYMLEERIMKIQDALGIEVSEFQ